MFETIYRLRWLLSAVMLASTLGLVAGGGSRVGGFFDKISAFSDDPDAFEREPMDPRPEVFIDPDDPGLLALYDLERRYIPEDVVLVAFEEPDAPWGVFSTEALEKVARLTERLKSVPYVRNVRSLTRSPWIRTGDSTTEDDAELLLTDLFERPPSSYTDDERLRRMIAVLGAEGAASLAGEDEVRRLLGPGARFSDHVGEPRLLGGVVSEGGRTTALQVQILRPSIPVEVLDETFGSDAYAKAVAPALHAAGAQWGAFAEIQKIAEEEGGLHLTGLPRWQRNFRDTAMRDMRFTGLMFVVIGLVMFVAFRKFSAVALPFLVVFSSIAGMMGAILLTGELLNNMTAMMPSVLAAIGVADSVHLIAAYFALRPRFGDKRTLIVEVLRRNFTPVLLTTATTAIGFASLTSSSVLPVRYFGVAGAAGALLAYLLSMTLVPALLSLLPPGKPQPGHRSEAEGPSSRSRGWIAFTVRRRVPIVVGALVVTAMSGFGILQLHVNSDSKSYFPPGNETLDDLLWMEERLGGTTQLEIVFEGPDDNSIEDGSDKSPISVSPEFIAAFDRFERRILEEAADPSSPLSVITKTESALDVLRKMHQVQNGNLGAYYRVPTDADIPDEARLPQVIRDPVLGTTTEVPGQSAASLVAQYYLQYGNGARPTEGLSRLVAADGQGMRLSVTMQQAPSRAQLQAFDRLDALARAEFPELAGSRQEVAAGDALATMAVTGRQYLDAHMITRFSLSLVTSLSLALALISLVIGLVFRSAVIGLVSMIPNVLPLAIPLGFLGFVGAPLDAPAVIVAAIALGICVDDTIHFLSRFVEGRRAGYDVERALVHVVDESGLPLTVTTVALVLGFGVVALSDFKPNVLIGELAVAMIGLAWAADFIVTPAVLSLFGARTLGEAKPSTRAVEKGNEP